MRFHTIKTNGDSWWGRRCFLDFDSTPGTRSINNEFYLFPDSANGGINLELSGDFESTIAFHIRIPKLFSWYFSADCDFGQSTWWQKLLCLRDRKYDSREWGISFLESYGAVSGPSIHIKCGQFGNMHKSSDPWWYSIYIEPQELICGKNEYDNIDGETTTHKVMIPGGRDYEDREYELICKESVSIWSWPRFKKPLRLTRFEVSCEEGVKHPGKGTADYNCQESALFSSTSPAKSKEDAIQNFIDNAVYYRTNYPL